MSVGHGAHSHDCVCGVATCQECLRELTPCCAVEVTDVQIPIQVCCTIKARDFLLKSMKFWWVIGHRGQKWNFQVSLKFGFHFHQKSIFSPLLPTSDFSRREYLNVVKFYPLQVLQCFNKIFWQLHHPQWCDKTKISLHHSQVTRCNELIELAQYSASPSTCRSKSHHHLLQLLLPCHHCHRQTTATTAPGHHQPPTSLFFTYLITLQNPHKIIFLAQKLTNIYIQL